MVGLEFECEGGVTSSCNTEGPGGVRVENGVSTIKVDRWSTHAPRPDVEMVT